MAGYSPTHQWTRISLGALQNLQPPMSGSGPIHQQANTRSKNSVPTTTYPRMQPSPQRASTNLRIPQGSIASQHDLAPPKSSQQTPHKAGPGNQPDQESAIPTSMAHSSQPTTTEVHMQTTKEAPLEHIALITRGECTAGMHRMSPTKGHFSKQVGNITTLPET